MKVTVIMVATINGKITRGDTTDIYSWTSKEDQDYFFTFIQKYPLVVMGSGTYEAIRKNIKPQSTRKRLILTSDPKRYQHEEIKGEIEFTNDPPQDLITRLEKEGYKEMLLLGGGKTNKSFFEAGLVNELFLTIEPRLFGKGKSLISDGQYELKLSLLSQRLLNDSGTLLLHYEVKPS